MIYFLLAAYFVIAFIISKLCEIYVGKLKDITYTTTTIAGLIWPLFIVLVIIFVVKNYVTESL